MVSSDLRDMGFQASTGLVEEIPMVSSSTGAGVTSFWRSLLECAKADAVSKAGIGVHRKAA